MGGMLRMITIAAAALILVTGCSSSTAETASASDLASTMNDQLDRVTEVIEITEENDPNDLIGRPNGYASAAVLVDQDGTGSDLGVARGATVEVFDDAGAAQSRSDYIQGILEESPMLGSEYHFVSGSALLRVSGELPPSVADEYEAAWSEATGS